MRAEAGTLQNLAVYQPARQYSQSSECLHLHKLAPGVAATRQQRTYR